ncbi:MAG TPA: hypothetical protein VJM80_10865 [bacterium]|nr:hypothetical protein [bacterium]
MNSAGVTRNFQDACQLVAKERKIFVPPLLLFAVNTLFLFPLWRTGSPNPVVDSSPVALLVVNLLVFIFTILQYGWLFALITSLVQQRPLELRQSMAKALPLSVHMFALGICISILLTVLWLLSSSLFAIEIASFRLIRGLSGLSMYLALFGLFVGFLLTGILVIAILFLLLASPFAGPVLALERVGPLAALKIVLLFVKSHLLFALGMACLSGFIFLFSLLPLCVLLLLKGADWLPQAIRQSSPLYLFASQIYSLFLMGISTLVLVSYSLGYSRQSARINPTPSQEPSQ